MTLCDDFQNPPDHLSALVEFFLKLSEITDGNEPKGLALYIAHVSRLLAKHDWNTHDLLKEIYLKNNHIWGWTTTERKKNTNEDSKYQSLKYVEIEEISCPYLDRTDSKNEKLNAFLEFHYTHGLHINEKELSIYSCLESAAKIDQAIGLLAINNWNVSKSILLYCGNQRKQINESSPSIVWRESAQAYVTSEIKREPDTYSPFN